MEDTKLFRISWSNIKSAFIYALLILIIEILVYIIGVGSVFKIEWKSLIDAGLLPMFIFAVSILKNFLTTSKGNFLGFVKVK